MPAEVFQHSLANGLTLLAERMPHVRSAALNFLVPAGCAYDPPDALGLGGMLGDMITRGAGRRDSRELTMALDNLGIDRDESVGVLNMRFYGVTLSRNLAPALELYADILRRPHLPEEELDAVKALAEQDLQSLEDAPQTKVMVELRRHYYPEPLNKDRRGTLEGIRNTTIETLRSQYQRHFGPRGTILAIAGNFDWDALRDQVEQLFGDWAGSTPERPQPGPNRRIQTHLPKETTQTQIAIAYASVPIGTPDYYNARGAAGVLSGGMSSRLFDEVREKRGLCYSVHAGHETFKDRGSMLVYAGTRAERAQETLDVTLTELRKLSAGIRPDEVERVQAGLKSALIMAEESTSARAGSLANDWYYLGRVRSFDEIQASINSLTAESILDYVRRYPAEDFTIVTLGPSPLTIS